MFNEHIPVTAKPWGLRNEKTQLCSSQGVYGLVREVNFHLGRCFNWKVKVTQRRWYSHVDSNWLVSSAHISTWKNLGLLLGMGKWPSEIWCWSGFCCSLELNLGEPIVEAAFFNCSGDNPCHWLWVTECERECLVNPCKPWTTYSKEAWALR